MSEDIKIEVIRTTQDSLSKYIKKPPLTEKLLRKPPFRYLHDITTAVMRETGYLQGLYSQDELNPENIKDREAKIAFLEKLISAVNLSTGVNITARPNKIVAGLDVAKTNELLQTIANALEKKVDSSKAVEQVLNKKTKGGQQNLSKKESSKSKTSKDTKNVEAKTREPRTSDTLKKKTKEKSKVGEKPDPRKIKSKKDVSTTKVSKEPLPEEPSAKAKKKDESKIQEKISLRNDEENPANVEIIASETTHSSELKHDVKFPPSTPTQSVEPLPLENKDQLELKEENTDVHEEKTELPKEIQEAKLDNRKTDSGKPEEELKRPQSARAVHRRKPARKPSIDTDIKSASKNEENRESNVSIEEPVPPQSKEKEETKPQPVGPVQSESVAPRETKRPRTAARPASARPGAPRVRDRGTILLNDSDNKVASESVNVIVDSIDLLKDDDETLVTVEAPVTEAIVDQVIDESHLLTGDQGQLVSQILETQKELEDTTTTGTVSEAVQKVDITWSSGGQREQEAVTKEVEKLRAAIQSLTRAANPLGKLIDFLQEDIDSMQTELEMWQNTNMQLSKQLQAEERLTEESIEPLERQLEDISLLVEEQLEEISVVKAVIIRNDDRLTRLHKTSTTHLPG